MSELGKIRLAYQYLRKILSQKYALSINILLKTQWASVTVFQCSESTGHSQHW